MKQKWKKREREHEIEWVGKFGEIERSQRKGKHDQNIYMKKIFEEKCNESNSWYFEKVSTLDKLQSSELKGDSPKFKLEMKREIL